MRERIIARLTQKPITNRPTRHGLPAYESAVAAYLKHLEPLKTVRSVYRFGSYGVPGLSDIDLVVVFKNDARDFIHRYGIHHLGEQERYLFSHDPLFVDAKNFSTMHHWFPIKDIHHVSGEKIQTPAASFGSRNQKLIHLAQMIICYQLQLFSRFAFIGENFDQRVSENITKGFCNSLALWPESGLSEFSERYLKFRSTWFELEQKERDRELISFVADATILTFTLLERLNTEFQEHWFETSSLPETALEMGGDHLRFTPQWNPTRALEAFLEKNEFVFPQGLGLFALAYKNSPSIFGNHVRNLFGTASKANVSFRKTSTEEEFKAHLTALEDYARFVPKKFGIRASPFVTFWAPHTENQIRKIYDRVYNKAHKTFIDT